MHESADGMEWLYVAFWAVWGLLSRLTRHVPLASCSAEHHVVAWSIGDVGCEESESLAERINAAFELAMRYPHALVVASGGGVQSKYPEASVIKSALVETSPYAILSVPSYLPPSRIFRLALLLVSYPSTPWYALFLAVLGASRSNVLPA